MSEQDRAAGQVQKLPVSQAGRQVLSPHCPAWKNLNLVTSLSLGINLQERNVGNDTKRVPSVKCEKMYRTSDLVYLITSVQEGEGGIVIGKKEKKETWDKSIGDSVWILLGSQFKQTHGPKTFFRKSRKFKNNLSLR